MRMRTQMTRHGTLSMAHLNRQAHLCTSPRTVLPCSSDRQNWRMSDVSLRQYSTLKESLLASRTAVAIPAWTQSPPAAWTQSPPAAWTPSGLPERPRNPRATEEPGRTTRSHARPRHSCNSGRDDPWAISSSATTACRCRSSRPR